jgi:tetratricopeptide (TPR) repeat protein
MLPSRISLDSTYAMAYMNRGLVKCVLGQWEAAIPDLSAAIRLDPTLEGAYVNRGTAKRKLNDYPGALDDFNHIIQLNPKNANAYMNRAFLYNDQKMLDAAISDVDKAIQIEPTGQRYFNRGQLKKALNQPGFCDDLQMAVKLGFAQAATDVQKYCQP